MTKPIIFHVTVDGIDARVVLNPTPDLDATGPLDSGADHLVVEAARKDAAGGVSWTAIPYRDSKRFVAAALFHAAIFGARPGEPIEVGKVEQSRFYLTPPPGARLKGERIEPARLLEDAAWNASKAKKRRPKQLKAGTP